MTERAGGRQSSIVNGKLVRTSVSQIRTARDCQVKWAFDKIDKVPRKPPGKGVLIGLEGHRQLEHYFKTGEDVRGPLAKAGDSMLDAVRHTFPFMGGAGLVESSLSEPTLYTPGGIEFVGFVDYAAKVSDELAVIVDHKFTKSIERYPIIDVVSDCLACNGTGRTLSEGNCKLCVARALETDEQAIVYGHWAALRFKTAMVEFKLNRYQTEGKRIFEDPSVLFTPQEVAAEFSDLAFEIDTVLAPLAGLARAIDATPNTAACSKYGGCDYAAQCPYSPVNRWLSNFTPKPAAAEPANESKETAMGLMDTLNKTATPAAVAQAPLKRLTAGDCKAEQEYILPGGPVGIFKAIAGTNAFFVGKADNAPRMLPIDTEVIDPTVVAPAPVVAKATIVSILPPDAPVSAPAAVAGVTAGATATGTIPAATETPATERKGPGRPKKVKDAIAVIEANITENPTLSAGTGGLILLIDCAFNQPARDLNTYVAQMARELADKSEVLDIRIAPKKTKEGGDHPLAFGGWKAMLSGIALKTLPEGLCSINSSELTDPVIEALAGKASLVVRGGVR